MKRTNKNQIAAAQAQAPAPVKVPLFPCGVQVKPGRPPLKYGNLKIPESTAIFSLPPVQTCGRRCPGCYAMKAQHQYKDVRLYRAEMYTFSQAPGFEAAVIKQIAARLANKRIMKKNRLRAVRVHEAGDFYSAAYARRWARIAAALPGVQFYAYTKRLDGAAKNKHIAAALRVLAALPNFVLINSLQYGGLCNYGPAEELKPAQAAGAFLCPCGPADGAKICGAAGQVPGGCNYCMEKRAQVFAPVFIKH